MLSAFLIDENLSPGLRHAFGELGTVHARDLGQSLTDTQLWAYATEQKLTVLTKDADFVDRMLLTTPDQQPSGVVRLHCGNLRARDMRLFLERQLPEVFLLLNDYRLVNVYLDGIEASLEREQG